MLLTNKQKALLHMVPAALGVSDAQRRMVQRTVGGFYSAADRTVSREGFIAVMAFYEALHGGTLEGFTTGYWKAEDEKATPRDALIWRIYRQGRTLGLSRGQVEAFLAGQHMSGGACPDDLNLAPKYWLQKLLQALIEIGRRQRQKRTA